MPFIQLQQHLQVEVDVTYIQNASSTFFPFLFFLTNSETSLQAYLCQLTQAISNYKRLASGKRYFTEMGNVAAIRSHDTNTGRQVCSSLSN